MNASVLMNLWERCAGVDGRTKPLTLADFEAILGGDSPPNWYYDGNGNLIGAGWAEVQTHLKHQVRAFLNYLAHPDHRPDLETKIILELEVVAMLQFPNPKDERPRILRLDFFDKHPDSVQLFEQLGYRFSHAEDEMRFDLAQAIPARPLPEGFTLHNWSADQAPAFHEVYQAAFSQRPNFPDWSQETWVTAFTSGEEFRAEWSWLLLEGDNPVGYTVCHEDAKRAFISQLGIKPSHQGQGLAYSLILHNLCQFAAAGMEGGWLEVNVDNPRATHVYKRIGFSTVRRYSSYQKSVG